MSEQLAGLRALLGVVKQSPPEKAEEEFYNLMVKAKETLGQTAYSMAQFYYQYANFIISKIQKNLDIFNTDLVPNNVQEEAEDYDNLPQQFEDSDSEPPGDDLNGDIPEVAEDESQQKQPLVGQQGKLKQNGEGNEAGQPEGQNKAEVEEQIDDKEISFCNLQFAIQIFETELQKIAEGKSEQSRDQILDGLRRARTRYGDLLMLNEEHQKCIQVYRTVIEQEKTRPDFETSRLIAELYYLIGNSLLYENASGCEQQAIDQYIKAIQILINHLSIKENYDVIDFQIPSKLKYKVDRFAYLSKPFDNEAIKEIKEIITCLLDKIEDAYEQIGVRQVYDAEKKKQEEEVKKSEFKPVPQSTKVINLGNFGNRKRRPDQEDKEKQNQLNKQDQPK